MVIRQAICHAKYLRMFLFAIRKNKVTLTLNKPMNIGISILESSKVLMYEFHYDYIKKNKYGNPAYNLYCRK